MKRLVFSTLALIVAACDRSTFTAPTSTVQPRNQPFFSSTSGSTGVDTVWSVVTDTVRIPSDTTWIAANHDDYQPGTTAHFAGGGWQPGEAVQLLVDDAPHTHAPDTLLVMADQQGNVVDVSYAITDRHLDQRFVVTASGQSSNHFATAQFTDGMATPTGLSPSSGPLPGGTTVDIGGTWSYDPHCISYYSWPAGSYSRCGSLSVRVKFGASDFVSAHLLQSDPNVWWWGFGIRVATPPQSAGTVDVTIEESECGNFYEYHGWWSGWYWSYRCWTLTRVLNGAYTYSDPNRAPTASAGGPYGGPEGTVITFSAAGSSDPDGDALTYAWDLDDNGTFGDAADVALDASGQGAIRPTAARSYDDEMAEWPGCYQVGVRVSDSKGAFSTAVACVGVSNVPPTITTLTATNAATGLQEPIRLVSGIATSTIDVAFRDPGERDRIVADIDCGNGTRSGGVGIRSPYRNTCTYAATGVYTVWVGLDDSDGGRDNGIYQYVVVYDPSAGFVTGGGWINSPAGACSATYCSYTGEGKASFGFVSKYVAGRNQPDGNTEFQFRAGGLNFKSTSYETLVVSGNRAQYWGAGTVNGAAGFTFRLTAVDGQVSGNDGTVDMFRIEIWAGNTVGAGQVVYDNQANAPQTAQLTTALGGGSITIKK